jgi:hypothetical protein
MTKVITERMVTIAQDLLEDSLVDFDHISVYPGDERRFCNSCRVRTDVDHKHGKYCIITRLRYLTRILKVGSPINDHVIETVKYIYFEWFSGPYHSTTEDIATGAPLCRSCGKPMGKTHAEDCVYGWMRELKDTVEPPTKFANRRKRKK